MSHPESPTSSVGSEPVLTVNAPKRTRRGEKFSLPTDVNLHANDFEWCDLLEELSDADRKLYESFREKCSERLCELEARMKLQRQEAVVGTDASTSVGCPRERRGSSASVPSKEEGDGSGSLAANGLGDVKTHFGSSNSLSLPCALVNDNDVRASAWERHYTSNRHMFPVKNYIVHAFPSLIPARLGESRPDALRRLCSDPVSQQAQGAAQRETELPPRRTIFEAGCGTGSVALPLMSLFPNDAFVCCDISATAISELRSHALAQSHLKRNLLTMFTLDLSSGGDAVRSALDNHVGEDMLPSSPSASRGFDFVLLVFVLSALPSLESMVHLLGQLRAVLKRPSGRLLFRDYGALDHNFFRFHRQQNTFCDESVTYIKGDGTQQHFFDVGTVTHMFRLAGLTPVDGTLCYHCNRIVNRKNGKRMDKVFVNGEFTVAS